MRKAILFFGDSITDGGRGRSMDGNHIIGHGYQSIIASKLGFENAVELPKFINKGNSGDSISQLYARLNEDVIKYKPDCISILAGINDIYKNIELPYKMTTNRYIQIFQFMIDDIRLMLDNPKIIICEPFYMELSKKDKPYKNTPYELCENYFAPGYLIQSEEEKEKIRKEILYMQEELKEFANRNKCIFVPLQNDFDNMAKKVPAEYLVWDSIHPTIVGHELIARKWIEIVMSSSMKI